MICSSRPTRQLIKANSIMKFPSVKASISVFSITLRQCWQHNCYHGDVNSFCSQAVSQLLHSQRSITPALLPVVRVHEYIVCVIAIHVCVIAIHVNKHLVSISYMQGIYVVT